MSKVVPIPDFDELERLLRRWNNDINIAREEAAKILDDLNSGRKPYTGGLTRRTELFYHWKKRALENLGLTDIYSDFSQLDALVDSALYQCKRLGRQYYSPDEKREIRERIKKILKEFQKKKEEMEKVYPHPRKYNWYTGMNKWIDGLLKHGYIDQLSGKELEDMIDNLHRFKRYAMVGARVSKFEIDLVRIYDYFEEIDKHMDEVRDAVDNIRRVLRDKKMSKKERKRIIEKIIDHLMRMLTDVQWSKKDIEDYFSPHFKKSMKKKPKLH
jgi:ElaB/YqjD/DUF883 family membrane-anchored ribosome-binding protein